MALSKAQIRQLRGMGQQLRPLVIIGKNGLTDAAVKQADETLEKHELLKVQVQAGTGDAAEVSAALCEALHAQPVQIIGNRFVIYRRSTTQGVEHIALVRD